MTLFKSPIPFEKLSGWQSMSFISAYFFFVRAHIAHKKTIKMQKSQHFYWRKRKKVGFQTLLDIKWFINLFIDYF